MTITIREDPKRQIPNTILPHPPFWGTPKLHKEGQKRCTCARECTAFLVVNCYLDPSPLSEILYPPLISDYHNQRVPWSVLFFLRLLKVIPLQQNHGWIQHFGKGGGICGYLLTTKTCLRTFAGTSATFFFPLYEIWGSPKSPGSPDSQDHPPPP